MKTLWFKCKSYGWGWTPNTWQGWAVTIGYIILMIVASIFLDPDAHPDAIWIFVSLVIVLTVLFVYIAYKTGEKPRWQWGNDSIKK